jgi:hypothetical protein
LLLLLSQHFWNPLLLTLGWWISFTTNLKPV